VIRAKGLTAQRIPFTNRRAASSVTLVAKTVSKVRSANVTVLMIGRRCPTAATEPVVGSAQTRKSDPTLPVKVPLFGNQRGHIADGLGIKPVEEHHQPAKNDNAVLRGPNVAKVDERRRVETS
jgi:hypothetical protein